MVDGNKNKNRNQRSCADGKTNEYTSGRRSTTVLPNKYGGHKNQMDSFLKFNNLLISRVKSVPQLIWNLFLRSLLVQVDQLGDSTSLTLPDWLSPKRQPEVHFQLNPIVDSSQMSESEKTSTYAIGFTVKGSKSYRLVLLWWFTWGWGNLRLFLSLEVTWQAKLNNVSSMISSFIGNQNLLWTLVPGKDPE